MKKCSKLIALFNRRWQFAICSNEEPLFSQVDKDKSLDERWPNYLKNYLEKV